MKLLWRSAGAALVCSVLCNAGLAQESEQAPIPFEGGALTVTQTPDFDKVLAFDGKELARNFVVYYDRTVEIGGINVALFDVGDGGNACGPAKVMVWKSKDGAIQAATAGEDCGAPPAAVTDNAIYFVPYLVPGSSAPVQVWSPEGGLLVAGVLSFTPQPGAGWEDLEAEKLDNIVDAFDNEAVYEAGKNLLGSDMEAFATGLLTGGGTERTPSGVVFASGCVPHACGSADAFMAVDIKAQRLYLAQEGENPEPNTWPALAEWPAEVSAAMKSALSPPQ